MKISVEDLQEGWTLIKDVPGKSKYPLIPKNTELTGVHIEVLQAFLIREVDVQLRKPDTANRPVSAPVEQEVETVQEAVPEPSMLPVSSFDECYRDAVQSLKLEFMSWQTGLGVNIAKVRAILLPLLEQAAATKNWIQSTQLYTSKEDYLFNHAIATSLIAYTIAESMNYNKGACLQIAFAACLSDCGMAKIPEAILTKKERLTEAEWKEVMKHPIYSYQMIKQITLLKPETKLAVFQHHERLDGSGYPTGEKGTRVHTYSQIVALADVYHAMTSERVYKNMESPFKTIQILEEDHFGQFDVAVLKVLKDVVLSLSAGTIIKLSDGRQAEVVFLNPQAQTRPLVKIEGSGEIIDLSENRSLYINHIIK